MTDSPTQNSKQLIILFNNNQTINVRSLNNPFCYGMFLEVFLHVVTNKLINMTHY